MISKRCRSGNFCGSAIDNSSHPDLDGFTATGGETSICGRQVTDSSIALPGYELKRTSQVPDAKKPIPHGLKNRLVLIGTFVG